MFLLFFLVFTLIFTIFENIFLASISVFLVCTILLIYQFISRKKILGRKLLISLLGGFFLAGIIFGIKEYLYYGGIQENQTTIIGTGIVSDISSQGKYVFTYGDADYLLYSKKEYGIGDQIRIVGRIQNSQHQDGFSYRKISSGTFAVPLFSGSFDFAKRMKMKGRKGIIYEDNSIRVDVIPDLIGNPYKANWIPAFAGMTGTQSNPSPSIGWIKQMKKGLQEKIIQVYGKNRVSGLILGMLIGDKSQIPESEYQSFINSGLVHLVAVSGGNILMIVVFLQCILLFIPFYPRLGLILLTIIGYSLMCGLDSSVFRAMLMGGLSMIALFRGREINIWRLLSISVFIMLIINPYFLAYDTGFLLSYSALIGIIYFDSLQKKNEKKEENNVKKGLQYIYKSYIAPSIGASIGIFPVIIFFMGKINLLGIVGNLFVLPLVPFVMIYGFVSIRLYSLLGWEWLLWIEKILVQYIYKISDLLSQYGLYFTVTGLRFKYLVLLVCIALFIIWRFRRVETLKNGKVEK
ncbi:MAG: ComEC/Rec2 family competence protein [Candidatus Absconditabacterales bacterium]